LLILKGSIKKSLDISSLKKVTQAKIVQEFTTKKNPSIDDCFESFRLPEVLDKNNLWYCPRCKVHVQASKKIEIYKVPPILIIHLKRFKIHGFYREKLTVPVTFPLKNLDISQHIIGDKPELYDLFAISNHFGALAGGHYTASVFVEDQKKWFNCNDSEISEATELSDVSSYVLFYKAKNIV
jgi:ubiquitin C-terminal hydrolase